MPRFPSVTYAQVYLILLARAQLGNAFCRRDIKTRVRHSETSWRRMAVWLSYLEDAADRSAHKSEGDGKGGKWNWK